MTILDFLPLFAGIGLFLYGMNLLAKAIENLADRHCSDPAAGRS